MTYRRRVEFSLPGVPISRPVTLGVIQLAPAPRDAQGFSQTVGHLIFETDRCIDDSDVRREVLPKLETVAIAAAALNSSVHAPVITAVSLENRAALDAAHVRSPLEDAGLPVRFDILAAEVDAAALATGYEGALALSGEDVTRWPRAVRWLCKANADPDAHDQFLALWIAFTVLYSPHRTETASSEQAGIRAYLAQAIPTEADAARLLSTFVREDLRCLGASGLTLAFGKDPIADELQGALDLPVEQLPRRDLLTLVIRVVYAVRNAIVHEGGVAIRSEREIPLVRASGRVLKTAMMALLRARLGV